MANSAFGIVKFGLERWPDRAAYILGNDGSESFRTRLNSLKDGSITVLEFMDDFDITAISASVARVFALTSEDLAVDIKTRK